MLNRIKAEPVLITGLVRAVILCLTAFGLRLSADQVAAAMLVTEAVLSLVTRQQVAPSGTPTKNEGGWADPGSLALGVVLGVALFWLVIHR